MVCASHLGRSLKPVITVFCERLKANQRGGDEWPHLPISQSGSGPRGDGCSACLLKQAAALKARGDALRASRKCDL